jgi:hypothetical protein
LRGGFEPVKMLFSARGRASDQDRGATGLRARLCLRLGCEKEARTLDTLAGDWVSWWAATEVALELFDNRS